MIDGEWARGMHVFPGASTNKTKQKVLGLTRRYNPVTSLYDCPRKLRTKSALVMYGSPLICWVAYLPKISRSFSVEARFICIGF